MKPCANLRLAAFALLLTTLVPAAGCGTKLQDNSTLVNLAEMVVVPDPDTVSVDIRDYCPAAGRSYRDLFAANFSVGVVEGQNRLDSDRDGVVDMLELNYQNSLNISPQSTDTNADGVGDLLVYLSGITREQQARLRCADRSDDDGDGILFSDPLNPLAGAQFVGLSNCEEDGLTHTELNNFDTDGDAIPDYLELRCNLNPREINDAKLDTDGDGISNYDECKRHTPVAESNKAGGLSKLEYKYSQSAARSGRAGCFDFLVSNVSVLNKGEGNLLAFYLLETDGAQQLHLYTAHVMVPADAVGQTLRMDFGPYPAGRFEAK